MINKNVLTPDELIIYERLLTKLPSTIIDSDYAIIVALLAMLLQSVNFKVEEIYKQINIETADEYYLRLLSEVIGYSWVENISLLANRNRLMSFQFLKKYRGSMLSIRNLVKSSIDTESFDNNINIDIYEGSHPYESNVPGHVITVVVPEGFEVARFDIDDVRPAGTLIRFLFRIFLSIDGVEKNLPIGLYKIKIASGAPLVEYVAGDHESIAEPLLPTWGAYTPLTELLNRPIVIYSTARGVTTDGQNFIISQDSLVTKLVSFNFVNTNTDWISTYLIDNSYLQGLYTITIKNDKIINVMEE
jgi:hypothetical protein